LTPERAAQSSASRTAAARHVPISFVSPGIQAFQPCHGSTAVPVGEVTRRSAAVKVGATLLDKILCSLL